LVRSIRPGSTGGSGARDARREGRYIVDEAASMTVLHPLSQDRTDIRIIEVSKRGLKLLVPRFLQSDSIIQVRVPGAIALGEVRYCAPAPEGFYAGLSIQDVVPNASALMAALLK
jgi:hypothetical protein